MRKLFIVCFLAIFSVSYGAQTNMARTIKSDVIALFQDQGYTVSQVLQLLNDLKATEAKDLQELNQAWAQNEPILLEKIQQDQNALDAQVQQCDDIQNTIDKQNSEKDIFEENVASAQQQIVDNNAAVQQREEQRCSNSLLFLEKVRNIRNAIELLQFLKDAMTEQGFKDFVATQPAALIMLKEAIRTKHENSLGQLTHLHLLAKLNPVMITEKSRIRDDYQGNTDNELDEEFDKKARTQQEIGSGHLDNSKGELGLEGYDYSDEDLDHYVNSTVAFIDSLIADFMDDLNELQENEEEAVHSFLKFKTEIERQNHVLTQYIEECLEHIAKLEKTIAQNEAAHLECVGQIPPLESQLAASQEAYEDAKEAYEARNTNLENTIPVIEQAIHIYTEQVHAAADTYHERVSDYAPDEDFDQTDYEHRETNEAIDNFNPTAGIGA